MIEALTFVNVGKIFANILLFNYLKCYFCKRKLYLNRIL